MPGNVLVILLCFVDGVGCVNYMGVVRVKLMTTTLRFQDLKTDFNSLLGGGRFDGHPGATSGWPGCMEKRHDILRKASPRHEETDGYTLTGSLPV